MLAMLAGGGVILVKRPASFNVSQGVAGVSRLFSLGCAVEEWFLLSVASRLSTIAAACKWVAARVGRLVSGKSLVAVNAHLMLEEEKKGGVVIVTGMHLQKCSLELGEAGS